MFVFDEEGIKGIKEIIEIKSDIQNNQKLMLNHIKNHHINNTMRERVLDFENRVGGKTIYQITIRHDFTIYIKFRKNNIKDMIYTIETLPIVTFVKIAETNEVKRLFKNYPNNKHLSKFIVWAFKLEEKWRNDE